MKNNKHTPGPWNIQTYENNTFRIRSDLSHHKHTATEESVAIITGNASNAHLIAAAPEMYELLGKINTAFYTRTSRKEWLSLMELTKPLLQKARGEK